MTKAGKIIDQVTGTRPSMGLGVLYLPEKGPDTHIACRSASPRTLWPTHGLITDFQSFLQEWQLA